MAKSILWIFNLNQNMWRNPNQATFKKYFQNVLSARDLSKQDKIVLFQMTPFVKGGKRLKVQKTATQLNKSVSYIINKIKNGNENITQKNLWVLDNYLKLEQSGLIKAPESIDTFLKTFKSKLADENFKLDFTANKLFRTNSKVVKDTLISMKENYIVDMGGVDNVRDLDKRQVIDIKSSWLLRVIYDPKENQAIMNMARSDKTYTFYNVPFSALYILALMGGSGMWNGFGFKYSTNPTHWIKGSI